MLTNKAIIEILRGRGVTGYSGKRKIELLNLLSLSERQKRESENSSTSELSSSAKSVNKTSKSTIKQIEPSSIIIKTGKPKSQEEPSIDIKMIHKKVPMKNLLTEQPEDILAVIGTKLSPKSRRSYLEAIHKPEPGQVLKHHKTNVQEKIASIARQGMMVPEDSIMTQKVFNSIITAMMKGAPPPDIVFLPGIDYSRIDHNSINEFINAYIDSGYPYKNFNNISKYMNEADLVTLLKLLEF